MEIRFKIQIGFDPKLQTALIAALNAFVRQVEAQLYVVPPQLVITVQEKNGMFEYTIGVNESVDTDVITLRKITAFVDDVEVASLESTEGKAAYGPIVFTAEKGQTVKLDPRDTDDDGNVSGEEGIVTFEVKDTTPPVAPSLSIYVREI